MTRDGERAIELINELATRVGNVLTDMVPPSAQVHLLNAQRELITALVLIYEHRVTAGPAEAAGSRGRTVRRSAVRRRPRAANRIPIE
ncbi:MAG TPA: hypothetical protein VGV88_03305 [Candidatus Dormibacteraeota bacterium]|nr:hypothetical protein [Candidatus Dormibacteraeota bacterium]